VVRARDPQRRGATLARVAARVRRPGSLFAEAANPIWKKIRREELTPEEGQQLATDIGRIAVQTISCRALAQDEHALANATGRSVYDSMYVALPCKNALTQTDRSKRSGQPGAKTTEAD
jgi:predicted nucleic acid-binding protein